MANWVCDTTIEVDISSVGDPAGEPHKITGRCAVAYAVGAPCCPVCGGTEHHESGQRGYEEIDDPAHPAPEPEQEEDGQDAIRERER